jgi:transcriptional regulator with XRE-family HTH domain
MASLETFQTFGESLKAARIEQKRSLDDIASAIKINRRHLESIEAGDLAKLPQGPYVAAFIREYARALGLAVPAEFAQVSGATAPSPRDPKVVSHPAGVSHERGAPLSHVARGTARFANTAVKSAAKTVSKTTENMVNFVETGSKEALEVLTSKSLWEEAENTRRERQGLPPIERAVDTPPKRSVREVPLPEETASQNIVPKAAKRAPIRSSKRATNVVIVLLAIVFAGVAYLAIRMSKKESGSLASKDYIPAPVEKPQPMAAPKHETAPSASIASATPAVKDSLRFVIRATEPVWISIAPDGIPAYRGELKTGETRSFRAAEKIEVNIGNQKSVVMTFDGAPLAGLPSAPNSSVVVRDLVLMRDHVTLGGNTIDIHKLAGVPPSPKAIAVAPAKAPAPPQKASVPASIKKTVPPPIHKSTPSVPAKNASHTTVTSKKPLKKAGLPPPVIHPVEPIPPRP